MVEFLSAEWFDALGSVDAGTDGGLTFSLDQAIAGTPRGDVRYRVSLTGGRLCVDSRPATEPADATLRLAYPTAVDLASGRRTAHDALLAGEVTFAGDPARLQELSAALGVLTSALGALRDETTFP